MEELFSGLDSIYPQNLLVDFHAIVAFYCLYPFCIFHSTYLRIKQTGPLIQVHMKYGFRHGLISDIYS